MQNLSYLPLSIFPFSNACLIPQFCSFICVQPTNSQFSNNGLNSLKYWSNSLYSISDISNVENPGVSAIYVFSSISYSFVDVVVFFPFLFLWLISPSCVIVSLNIALISVYFPTTEFPENAFIFPFNFFSSSCIPVDDVIFFDDISSAFSNSFAIVSINVYPMF